MPFSTYYCTFSSSFDTVPIHWHEEIEITLINNGTGEHKIDLIPYSLEQGDIVIIKPLSLHSLHQIDNKKMSWSSMVFNLNMINTALADGCLIKYFAPILNNENELPLVLKKNCNGYEEIRLTLENIFNCYNKKDFAFELQLKSLLYYLFFIIYKNHLIKEKKNSSLSENITNKIKIIINYIKENYTKEISVKDIATSCNYSEFHFMRFFKKYIGMTCVEYVNNCRLELASELLNNSDKTILNISFEVGYNNVSYFNKLFKKKFNVTPKEFRLKKKNVQ